MNCLAITVLICVICISFIVEDIKSTSYNGRYSPLNNLTIIGTYQADVHSEYFMGECNTEERELVQHANFTYEEMKGLTILRGPLNITNNHKPNCVYIKATSTYDRMINYRSLNFTVCIVKVYIVYTTNIFKYFYWEWFMPMETKEDIIWDIFFYYTADPNRQKTPYF